MSLLSKIGKIAGGALGGPVGAAVGGLAGSLISGKGAKKAAGVQAGSNEAAAQEQRNALNTVTGYQQPYMALGTGATNQLNALNSGDYSGFESSPDYLFAQQQGAQARERSAAAKGGLNSGNTLAALEEYGQGLASQNLGNYRNSLFQTIGVGQGATNQLTGATLNTAGNVGQYLTGAGDARASGIVGQTNALTNGIDEALTGIGDYSGAKKKAAPVNTAQSTYNMSVRAPTTNRVGVY